MKQEIAGQPVWLWLTAAGVVVVGYLWFKHSQSSASSQPSGPPAKSTSSFQEWITQHQAPSKTHKHPKPAGQ